MFQVIWPSEHFEIIPAYWLKESIDHVGTADYKIVFASEHKKPTVYRVSQQKSDAQNLTVKKHLKTRFKIH